MLPIVSVPESIAIVMNSHRKVFCRKEGFEHVSRYVTGLITSPNKTLQGIYDWQVYDEPSPSRRAMHQAVFEKGWDSDELIQSHRQQVSAEYQGQGRHVISVDWTFAHHDKGSCIYGVKKSYDYVENTMSRFQTVVTATVANASRVDGLEAAVQQPSFEAQEQAYLNATVAESYEQTKAAARRLVELLHYETNRKAYKKRTEIAVDIVKQIEDENQFPDAHYAFDNGVLTLELTRLIENCDKHWVSQIECSRHIQWRGEWKRADALDKLLRLNSPHSFRPIEVKSRNGEVKSYWVFTKVVRLKRYGRKRLVIVHEADDLTDEPRFLLTDATHWESRRIIQTWNYRWASEIFHEFAKQVTGFEQAQVRNQEAVKRHFRLSCVAQSVVQKAEASGGKSERFSFVQGKPTFGQRCRTVIRQVLLALIKCVSHLTAVGKTGEQILQTLMPD